MALIPDRHSRGANMLQHSLTVRRKEGNSSSNIEVGEFHCCVVVMFCSDRL